MSPDGHGQALAAQGLHALVGGWPTFKTCPIDATNWGRKNRVKLWPGKANIWTLKIRLLGNPSHQELADQARNLMIQWFSHSWWAKTYLSLPDAAVMPATLTRVSVLEISAADPGSKFLENADLSDTGLKTGYLAQMAENMIPEPQMRAGRFMYVTLEFDYWGTMKWMPWPTWDEQLAGFTRSTPDRFCPLHCDAMLWQSLGNEDNFSKAETDATAFDQALKDAAIAAGSAYDAVTEVLKVSFYVAAGVGGLYLAAKVIR